MKPENDPTEATRAERARRFRDMAFNGTFGLEFAPREPGRAEVRLAPRREHLQIEGVVHGGTLATLGDTAGVYSIYPDLPEPLTMTMCSCTIPPPA